MGERMIRSHMHATCARRNALQPPIGATDTVEWVGGIWRRFGRVGAPETRFARDRGLCAGRPLRLRPVWSRASYGSTRGRGAGAKCAHGCSPSASS